MILPGHIEGYYKVQNQGAPKELYLPENGFKTCYRVYISKKSPDFGGLEIKGRHEIQI